MKKRSIRKNIGSSVLVLALLVLCLDTGVSIAARAKRDKAREAKAEKVKAEKKASPKLSLTAKLVAASIYILIFMLFSGLLMRLVVQPSRS